MKNKPLEFRNLNKKNKMLCEDFLLNNEYKGKNLLEKNNFLYFNVNLEKNEKSKYRISPVKNYIKNINEESPGKFSKFHKNCKEFSLEKKLKTALFKENNNDNNHDNLKQYLESENLNENNKKPKTISNKIKLILEYLKCIDLNYENYSLIPNLLPKNSLIEKTEYIYECISDKVFKNRRKGIKFGVIIQEIMNIKYKGNKKAAVQNILNILYSCKKYEDNFFKRFLNFLIQEDESSLYFYLYIRYYVKLAMNINFHSLLANNKFNTDKLKIKNDIAFKIVENTFNFDNEKCIFFKEKFKNNFKKKQIIGYYELLNYIEKEFDNDDDFKKLIFKNFYEKEIRLISPKKYDKKLKEETEEFSYNLEEEKNDSSNYELISKNNNNIKSSKEDTKIIKELNFSFSNNQPTFPSEKVLSKQFSILSDLKNYKKIEPKENTILKKYLIKVIKSYVYSLGIINKNDYEMDTLMKKLIYKYMTILETFFDNDIRNFQKIIRTRSIESENFFKKITEDLKNLNTIDNSKEMNSKAEKIFREPILFEKTEFLIKWHLEDNTYNL